MVHQQNFIFTVLKL